MKRCLRDAKDDGIMFFLIMVFKQPLSRKFTNAPNEDVRSLGGKENGSYIKIRRKKMEYFKDGNQLCVTKDDFIDLQESPAVFFNLESNIAKTIISEGFTMLPLGDLRDIAKNLGLKSVDDASDPIEECEKGLIPKSKIRAKIREILDDFEREVWRVDKQPISKKTCVEYITLLRELGL